LLSTIPLAQGPLLLLSTITLAQGPLLLLSTAPLARVARDSHVLPHIVENSNMSEEGKERLRKQLGIAKPKPPEPSNDLSWLTFDSRRPLPSLVELDASCHFVGTRSGWAEYLCSRPTSPDCKKNDDFSAYYGKPIYLCRQPAS